MQTSRKFLLLPMILMLFFTAVAPTVVLAQENVPSDTTTQVSDTHFQTEGEESGGVATAVVLSLLGLILVIIFAVAIIAAVGLGSIGLGAASIQSDED
jgi:hypothetical protein